MAKVHLLAMSGSARRESFNRRVLAVMVRGAEAEGATVTLVEPNEFTLPLYDADLEAAEGLPEAAARLQRMFAEHHGLLLASPEYNGFFTPLVKNTFDWVSRPLADGSRKPGTVHMRGKPAGVAGASTGAMAAIQSLQFTRLYLSRLGFLVVPEQAGVPHAAGAFDENGRITDDRINAAVEGVGAAVARLAAKL